MPRSIKVKPNYLNQVRQSLQRNNYPSQGALALDLGMSRPTINKFFNGKAIDHQNFIEICEQLGLYWQEISEINSDEDELIDSFYEPSIQPIPNNPKRMLISAPDVSKIQGRTKEIEELKKRIIEDKCPLVAIWGFRGLGKTTVAAKIAKDPNIDQEFEYIIWHDLRGVPSLKTILRSIIKVISQQKQLDSFNTIEEGIDSLITYLNEHRCLIVFDDFESICQDKNDKRSEDDSTDCQEYEQLFDKIAGEQHKSCLLLTCRKLPENWYNLNPDKIHSLELEGLNPEEARTILRKKNIFDLPEEEKELIEKCSGNPTFLEMVASNIWEYYQGDITEFLDSNVLSKIESVEQFLEQEYDKSLSTLEQRVVQWLAILQEPVNEKELANICLPILAITLDINVKKLKKALISLKNRSLVQEIEGKYQLQPLVIEFLIVRFVNYICENLKGLLDNNLETINKKNVRDIFNRYLLMQPQAPKRTKDSQIQHILKPVKETLKSKDDRDLNEKMRRIFPIIKYNYLSQPGYAAGNFVNLFWYLNFNPDSPHKPILENYDFSYLTIWEADFRKVFLKNVNFTQAKVKNCAFLQSFGGILSVALSQDNQWLVIGDGSGNVHLYKLENYQLEFYKTYSGHTHWVRTVAISHDNKYIANGGEDRTVHIWERETGNFYKHLKGYDNRIRSIIFSPDSKILATASDDGQVILWNIETEQRIKTYTTDNRYKIHSVLFNSSGNRLIFAKENGYLYQWDWQEQELPDEIGLNGYNFPNNTEKFLRTIALSPDGQLLATGGYDGSIQLWYLATGQFLQSFEGHTNWVRSIIFSNNSQYLISCSEDRTIRIWNLKTGDCLNTLLGHRGRVWAIVLNKQDNLLISVSDDQKIKLWEFPLGKCLNVVQGYTHKIRSVAFSPDDKFLASGSDDGIVRLWNIDTKKCEKTLSGHEGRVWSVAFSPDGKKLVSGSDDRTIRIWNLETDKPELLPLKKYPNWVRSVAFSPKGDYIASSGDDKFIYLYYYSEKEGWKEKFKFEHNDWIHSICFSPDGKTLFSGSDDNLVKKWDIERGEFLLEFSGHTSHVRGIAVSRDGKTLASGSNDRTIKLWDSETKKCKHTLEKQRDWIKTVDFHPNGEIIASGDYDQMIRLWNVKTGD